MPDKEKVLKKKRGKQNVKHCPEPVRGKGRIPTQGLTPKLMKGAIWWDPAFPRGDTWWCLGTSVVVTTGRTADIEWVGGPGMLLNPPSSQDTPAENDTALASAVPGAVTPGEGVTSQTARPTRTDTGRAEALLGAKDCSQHTDQHEPCEVRLFS